MARNYSKTRNYLNYLRLSLSESLNLPEFTWKPEIIEKNQTKLPQIVRKPGIISKYEIAWKP